MKCSVTFRHMDSSESVKRYAEERVDKLTKVIDRGVEAQVVLEASKHLFTVHVELITDGSLLMRGIDTSEDLKSSIDAAVERILRQAKRYRAKIKRHRAAAHPGREFRREVYSAAEEQETGDLKTPQLVKHETLIAKPMTIEDAVMQMDLLNAEFLVFTNASSHQVNVVYRLPDGQFGLIEALAAA